MLNSMLKLGQRTNSLQYKLGRFRNISRSRISFEGDQGISIETSKSIVNQSGQHAPKPSSVLVLPVTRRPIFPGFMSTILIKNEHISEELISSNGISGQYVGVFLRSDSDKKLTIPEAELITDANQLHKVGTFSQIIRVLKTDTGAQVQVIGHRRINLKDITSMGPPCIANISHWPKTALNNSNTIKAYSNQIVQVTRELISLNPLAHEHIQQWVQHIDLSDPYKLADFAAVMTTAEADELQKVLECVDLEERLELALNLLNKERDFAKIQHEIANKVEQKMTKDQRKYILREQAKKIKEELDEKDDDKQTGMYQDKLDDIKSRGEMVSSEVIRAIQDEIYKLSTLEKHSSEYSVTRSYLDWLTNIPWGILTEDKMNLRKAQKALDEDHYGMDEVKKRIMEFIAVGKLKKSVTGKIICLIGPPGVGKTSIAKSIASALDRKFYRFSVGGLTDIAEIKGHRRTYIGAMPGKPIQCLKTTGSINPLILIDEIDKLGRGYNGDPASALLELLDPNQNTSFVDHYLDVPADFSNVLFVCTANDESTIPGPLKDRMEVIRLSGYDLVEKVAIANKYLVPKAVKDSGLAEIPGSQVVFTTEALESLAKNFCRESGVRSLEKHIEKLVRKIAFEIVVSQEDDEGQPITNASDPFPITITDKELEKYLGKPRFPQETIYDSKDSALPPGIVMGLAWNPLGGSPIFIETAAIPTSISESGGGVNVVTGQLGSVMKESANIAYTFARKFVNNIAPENLFFKSHQLHLHVPEGAVEKDGPSAGVAMACSFISLSTNRPLTAHLAMTGELSLTGLVLPVGGIKEKILAGRRAGAKIIILPHANRRDFDDLPIYVKDSLTVHFVKDFSEVYKVAFQ